MGLATSVTKPTPPPLVEDLNNLLTLGRHTPAKKVQQSNDAIILDTEAAVMANFEFLGPTEMSDDDEISDDLEMVATDNEDTDVKIMAKRPKSGKDMLTEGKPCPHTHGCGSLLTPYTPHSLSLSLCAYCPPAPTSLHVVCIPEFIIIFCKASI